MFTPAHLMLTAEFDNLVQSHLDGLASAEQISTLKARESEWVDALIGFLEAAEDAFEAARKSAHGPGRLNVLDDLGAERDQIDDILTELVGPEPEPAGPAQPQVEQGVAQLQLAWYEGQVVAWAAGLNAAAEAPEQILERLKAHGAGSIDWVEHQAVKIPGVGKASALSAPLTEMLGWLVALGA
ncbi:MAG: hypothetical protein V3V01_19190, partial [Acidimicrobiales bacterium]